MGIQIMAQRNDITDNSNGSIIGGEIIDKGFVNFQGINGKALEIAQRLKSGAEIVQGNSDVQCFYFI